MCQVEHTVNEKLRNDSLLEVHVPVRINCRLKFKDNRRRPQITFSREIATNVRKTKMVYLKKI